MESTHWIEKGFFLEKEGKKIAKIFNPVYYDMFWRAYTIEYFTINSIILRKMKKVEFWDGVKFFSLGLKDYVSGAFVALQPFDENGRLIVRGENLN